MLILMYNSWVEKSIYDLKFDFSKIYSQLLQWDNYALIYNLCRLPQESIAICLFLGEVGKKFLVMASFFINCSCIENFTTLKISQYGH